MKIKTMTVFFLAIGLLALTALSCSIVSRAGDIKATGEALATGVQNGREIMGTGQALVTQIDESGIKGTMEAYATEIGAGNLMETAQAVATEFESGGLKETAQAFTTDLPGISGEKPADIPVIADGVSDVIASASLVSYLSTGSFQAALDFYQAEMPLNGWSKIERESSVRDNLATLVFEKSSRRASVLITEIPFINQVTVLITIENP